MTYDPSNQHGTTACPICGKDEPHYHAPHEDWRTPVAWACELAHAYSQIGNDPVVWSNWQPSLTWHKPNVPNGSIRNLRPLYALPAGQIAGKSGGQT